MLQRKQTLYLLLSLIVLVTFLPLQIGVFSPSATMGADARVFNLWMVMPDGSKSLAGWPLFVILFAACITTVYTISAYKRRMFQSKLCIANICLIVAWYIYYILFGYIFAKPIADTDFHPFLSSVIPLAALAFQILARRGIIADENLVRSADRFR